ncbi:aldehyde dehydrogenase [Frankia sp. Ag45/Mut15]|uniref:aldehyde dehydrogenase (NAD(+)) n=1 Tax=Frankia umida TaxID=573489 RepID=A0ABT0K458_9ACTN|nr:aldehyde dehydrogenase [Frankia umida]MCK9878322.1 aldehyde dehydrogenase [Frankia umida]
MRGYDRLFIGGNWERSTGTDVLDVHSPHSTELVGRTPAATTADVDRAVAAARDAFDTGPWPRLAPGERIALLRRFAELYVARAPEFAELITAEMGSPIGFSQTGQTLAPWLLLTTLADLAETYPWEAERTGVLGDPITVRREPVGVVGAIVPWNVPQAAIMSKLAPALLAGCTVVVKPAPETALDALALAEVIAEVGFPAGVVSVLPAGREIGEHLVTHPGIDKIAFTGSTAAGRRIAALCGERLRRVTLELGGKSAAIILDDADLAATVDGLKMASFMNNGQACVAQTRILASRARYTEVVDALADLVATLRVGDPADPATDIGPLVAARQQERVEHYITLGQAEGARVVAGGNGRPPGQPVGWYVRPTVFADASNDMRIAREEIFGPVLTVIPYADEAQAVELANDSEYGLAGSVWTADAERGLDVARRVRTGTFAVNRYTTDFAAPFGGYKASGIGREHGPEGFDAYVELKSIAGPAT